jgi:hypothetical protein
MLDEKQIDVYSIEQLISRLEHIEESELQSDIRANVCAELRRIKRNVSAVLSFIDHSRLPDDPLLRATAADVRRECILINGIISRTLFLYFVRIGRSACLDATSRVVGHYRGMAEATCQLCQLLSPSCTQSMAMAL